MFDVTGVRSMLQSQLSLAASRLNNVNIPRAVNGVLAAMAVCNTFLFFSSFVALSLPNNGFNTFLVTVLSCAQNALIVVMLNGQHFTFLLHVSSRHSLLNPSPFHVGAMLGASVGVGIMNLLISVYFGQLSKCQRTDVEITQYKCDFKGAMRLIWFFAGLLFWLNAALAALIALGKDELALGQGHYEDIDVSSEEFDSERTRLDKQQGRTPAAYEMV